MTFSFAFSRFDDSTFLVLDVSTLFLHAPIKSDCSTIDLAARKPWISSTVRSFRSSGSPSALINVRIAETPPLLSGIWDSAGLPTVLGVGCPASPLLSATSSSSLTPFDGTASCVSSPGSSARVKISLSLSWLPPSQRTVASAGVATDRPDAAVAGLRAHASLAEFCEPSRLCSFLLTGCSDSMELRGVHASASPSRCGTPIPGLSNPGSFQDFPGFRRRKSVSGYPECAPGVLIMCPECTRIRDTGQAS